VGEAIDAGHGEAFDLLLGRRTYEISIGDRSIIGRRPGDRRIVSRKSASLEVSFMGNDFGQTIHFH
jgi:hypothetical protein